jgi:hypothetical protein
VQVLGGFFVEMRELRIIATRINRTMAKEFKQLSPQMRVYWVGVDEWLDRRPGAADPADLAESIDGSTSGYEIPFYA